MTLGTAVLLLLCSIIGIVLSCIFLRQRKPLCIILIVLFSLLAAALVVYIGLTVLFVDAVMNQPPV